MSEVEEYLTLATESEGLYKEKGSKFHGYASHVSDLEEVKAQLEEVKKAHHSARHHCYAYRLGADGADYRANDDGEPNHSAGDPILGQIDSYGLTNVLIVVVRYFGGIKLGVGGLITAYRAAAQEAIDAGRIVKRIVRCRFDISFGYHRMSDVMRVMKMHEAEMISNAFEVSCSLRAEVVKAKQDDFLHAFVDLHDVEVVEVGSGASNS